MIKTGIDMLSISFLFILKIKIDLEDLDTNPLTHVWSLLRILELLGNFIVIKFSHLCWTLNKLVRIPYLI